MLVEQIQVGQMIVFAYLIGDEQSGEAIIIDPAGDTEALIALASKNNLNIKYIVNTHGHVDHICGNSDMKQLTGATLIIHESDAYKLIKTPSSVLNMFHAKPSPPADMTVRDGDRITIGSITLAVLHTPGHSPGSMSLFVDGMVFTGDTLFVEAVGRTDFPDSSWPVMYKAIQEKLFTLSENTKVLPGHNYGRTPTSTIGHEKKYNPFLQ